MRIGAVVVETEAMPLRRPKAVPPPPELKAVHYKARAELKQYVDEVKKLEKDKPGARDQSDIINDAVELDRDLGRLLSADDERIQAFAEASGLDMADGLSKVLAKLIRIGLDHAPPMAKVGPVSTKKK